MGANQDAPPRFPSDFGPGRSPVRKAARRRAKFKPAKPPRTRNRSAGEKKTMGSNHFGLHLPLDDHREYYSDRRSDHTSQERAGGYPALMHLGCGGTARRWAVAKVGHKPA